MLSKLLSQTNVVSAANVIANAVLVACGNAGSVLLIDSATLMSSLGIMIPITQNVPPFMMTADQTKMAEDKPNENMTLRERLCLVASKGFLS